MTELSSPKDVLLHLLDEGMVMLHINAKHEDVIVPSYLKDDVHLRLNLSYRFRLPDLQIDDEMISATLSFQKQPFRCCIPFVALWGLSQPHDPENLIIFPDALPIEMLALALQAQQEGQEEEDAPTSSETSSTEPTATNPEVAPAIAAQPAPTLALQPKHKKAAPKPAAERPIVRTSKRPALQLVVDRDPEDPPPSKDPSPPTAKRPVLRLVKGKEDESP